MQIEKYKLEEQNQSVLDAHRRKFEALASGIKDIHGVLKKFVTGYNRSKGG